MNPALLGGLRECEGHGAGRLFCHRWQQRFEELGFCKPGRESWICIFVKYFFYDKFGTINNASIIDGAIRVIKVRSESIIMQMGSQYDEIWKEARA